MKKKLSVGSYDGAKFVWAGGAIEKGTITGGFRKCQLEGCRGTQIAVRWKDGKITYPCTECLKTRKDGQLQIR